MKQTSCFKSSNNKEIKEPNTAKNIELLIQIMYKISIPSIIFEYISNKEANFEINDLKNFYTSFGEVIDFVIRDKKSIVLYKTFFSANACREFILNENNYKENMRKDFSVRWFDYDKDMAILPPEMQKIFKDIYNQNINNLKDNDIDIINMINIDDSNNNQINDINLDNNINNQNYINNNNNNNININNNNNNNIIQNQFNIIENQNSNINFISPNLINNYNQININQPQLINNNNLNNNIINNNIINNNFISNNLTNNNNINNNNIINNNINNIQNLNALNYISLLNQLSNNLAIPSQVNIPFIINNQDNNNIGINNINEMGININNINNNNNFYETQNDNQINNNDNNQNREEKDYGRFICKYQILIPNDKDFQIASRIIGSKGYNMKKIINECKNNNNMKDSVKLRLRGRGSGYKEGLNNKESDEPLHLCISAKIKEGMDKACILVENLLNKIYEDYKKYCIKNNIFPIKNQIAVKIDSGYSLHQNK